MNNDNRSPERWMFGRCRFRLRSLLLVLLLFTLVIGVGVVIVNYRREQQTVARLAEIEADYRRKENAIARLEELGAAVSYDYQWSDHGAWKPNASIPGDPQLQRKYGEHYAANPIEVQLFAGEPSMNTAGFSDDDAKTIAPLSTIKWLVLQDTKLSDAGIMHLAGISSLERLDVEGSDVTAKGANAFQAVRPEVKLYFGP